MSVVKVAKMAGVSPATVSRVINGRSGVSHERVEHVRQVMDQLGYSPAPLAQRPGRRPAPAPPPVRAERGKRSPVIAVAILDGLYQFTPGILANHLRGIEYAATEHGMNVVIANATRPQQLPPVLAQGDVDGVILMGSSASPELLASLEKFPSIWFSSHHSPSGDTVLSGNFEIGRLAADYLTGQGHRELGFLSAMMHYPAYPARSETFQFVAQRAGARVTFFTDESPTSLTGDPAEMIAMRDAIDRLAAKLAAHTPRITGLFVPNDMMASILYASLGRHGITPGQDVDIISCNNELAYLVGLRPRPATIDIGAEMMGRRSVEQLSLRMHAAERDVEDREVHVTVMPRLVEGEKW